MKVIFCLSLCCLFATVPAFSQQKKVDRTKPYVTSGGELIFSLANVDDNGTNVNSVLRFSPVFNIQTIYNKDYNKNFGLFTGLAIRNVGYTISNYKDPANDQRFKKKFRSYNLGIPVGFKIGNLDKLFFYGGYEFELAMFYKEKTFEDDDKIDKITGFFSKRQEIFQHGFLAGIQFPYGFNLKFKYYLSEFHNRSYTNSAGVQPYHDLTSNIFYFALNFSMFRNTDFYINNKNPHQKTVSDPVAIY